MPSEPARTAAPPEPGQPPAPTRTRKLMQALNEHRFAVGVTLAFVIGGPLVVRMVFPDVSPVLGLIGGVLFGGYAALCAVPGKFFGD